METNQLTLLVTIDKECSTVRFRGECDGKSTADQNKFAAAIYAAVMDVVQDSEVFSYYCQLADELANEVERAERRDKLTLVH